MPKPRSLYLWIPAVLLVLLLIASGKPGTTQRAGVEPESAKIEVRYYRTHDQPVYLVWGVNGWRNAPESTWPAGTFVRNGLLHTPMTPVKQWWSTTLCVPYKSLVSFGFAIDWDKSLDNMVWEANGYRDYELIPTKSQILYLAPQKVVFLDDAPQLADPADLAQVAVLLGLGAVMALVILGVFNDPGSPARLMGVEQGLWPEIARLIATVYLLRVVLIGMSLLTFALYEARDDQTVPQILTGYSSQLLNAFGSGDVRWYLGIANMGYEAKPFTDQVKANWVFYPMWPMLLRAESYFTGKLVLAGTLTAFGLQLLATGVGYRLLCIQYPREVASRAMVLMAAFPAAHFYFRAGNESLFLVLVLSSFLAAETRHWAVAGLLAALATLTRLQGLLLVPALLWVFYRRGGAEERWWRGVPLLLPCVALGGFMTYLWKLTGNPLAAIQNQKAWEHSLSYPFAAAINFVNKPFLLDYGGWNIGIISFLFLALAVCALFGMLSRRTPREYAIYAWLSVLLIIARDTLQATMRFMLPVFPIATVAAQGLVRRQRLYEATLLIFAALQWFFFVAYLWGKSWART